MPNEELIYRITRAVYDRLGAATDENIVEQLVTDIYRQVEPELRNGSGSAASFATSGSTPGVSSREGSADRLIVSVFGVDHPGIVAGVSQILADAGCSIVDIRNGDHRQHFARENVGN
jgi:UTP:GlnB (protein PII) uridylyltransferase